MERQVKILSAFVLIATLYGLMGALFKIRDDESRLFTLMFYAAPLFLFFFSLACKMFILCDRKRERDIENENLQGTTNTIAQLAVRRIHKPRLTLKDDDPPPYWKVVENPPAYDNLKRLSLLSEEDLSHSEFRGAAASAMKPISRHNSVSDAYLGFENTAYEEIESPKIQRSLSLSSLPISLIHGQEKLANNESPDSNFSLAR